MPLLTPASRSAAWLISESIVVMPKAANEGQVATLLDTMGTVSANRLAGYQRDGDG